MKTEVAEEPKELQEAKTQELRESELQEVQELQQEQDLQDVQELQALQEIQSMQDCNIQERNVDTVSKEDFLLNQIDEFRERAITTAILLAELEGHSGTKSPLCL